MNTQFVTSVIISGLIKPVLLLLLVSALWWLLRKKSASLQHFVLSLGVISIFILNILALGLAEVSFTLPPILASLIQLPSPWLDALNQWLITYSSPGNLLLVAGIYLLPATFLLFYLWLGVIGLWYQTCQAEPVQLPELTDQLTELRNLVGIQRPVELVVSRDVESPQTWGLFRPVIMLPRAALLWDQDKQLSLLTHELGHIARWDWLATLLVKMICACFWFLIPLWWLASQIYQQAEIACDDYIFRLRDKHLIYAQSLLAIAGDSLPTVANESLQMRGHSPVYQRIMAIHDQRRPHQPVAMETAQYWIICTALLLTFFACVQLIPIQEQLRRHTDHLLVIDWDSGALSQPKTDQNHAPNEAGFSWELLQQLKPAAPEQLPLIDAIETIHVSAAKPQRQELQSAITLAAITPEVPSIEIQGYLPISLVTPEYPPLALQKGIEGWVQVEFAIDADGTILAPRIIDNSPSSVFDRAVLSAVKKSRYRPQLLNGQPVVMHGVTETFRFQLLPADVSRRR